MAKAKLSSCLFLVLILLAAAEGGLYPTGGEPFQCIISWDCKDNNSCKKECSSNYPGGRGFCTGSPRACLCTYNCPPH